MVADLLQAVQVITDLGVQHCGRGLEEGGRGQGMSRGIGRDGGVAARNIEEKGGDANLEGVALLPVTLPVQEVSGDLVEKGSKGAMGGESCKKTTTAQ